MVQILDVRVPEAPAIDLGDLRHELSMAEALAMQTRDRHFTTHPELIDVAPIVHAIRIDSEAHLWKEEHGRFATVDEAESEHETVLGRFARLRAVTSGFTAPEGASPRHRALYERLAHLELAIRGHIASAQGGIDAYDSEPSHL